MTLYTLNLYSMDVQVLALSLKVVCGKADLYSTSVSCQEYLYKPEDYLPNQAKKSILNYLLMEHQPFIH